jgi:hypothetical protein
MLLALRSLFEQTSGDVTVSTEQAAMFFALIVLPQNALQPILPAGLSLVAR